jgi:hypothetical protein
VITITGITEPEYTTFKTNGVGLFVVPVEGVVGINAYDYGVANRGISSVNSLKRFARFPVNTIILELDRSKSENGRDGYTIFPWKGSGKYDLWLLEGTGGNGSGYNTIRAQHKYKAVLVDFSMDTITLDFSSFTKVQ